MKKWTKAALLTGCACCIAGAALILCGWADGGKAGTSQRKQPSVRIGVRRNYGKY